MTNFSAYCRVNTKIVQRAYCGSFFIVDWNREKKNSEFRNFHSFMIYSYYLCKRIKLEKKYLLFILGWVSHHCNCEDVNLRCGSSGLLSSQWLINDVNDVSFALWSDLIPESADESCFSSFWKFFWTKILSLILYLL